ncbi:MAG: IclR family transcriptional regulator [Burkholderiales bacterium]|nr:IclR family transcriptional regulator [Burkholderiales bacterium]
MPRASSARKSAVPPASAASAAAAPADDGDTDRQFANTLARGLQVLSCFTAADPILTNKDIAARTGLARPTVSRLTYTLTRLGYLRHHPRLGKYGKYELGTAVLSLAHPLLANISVRQIARLPMKELADYAGGWVSLGVRERLNMVYIETARSRATQQVTPDIGQTFPIVVSAMGRAYLAAVPSREREALINQLQVKTPELWRAHAEHVEQGLQDYIEHGFCVGRGDYHPKTHTVAVPLRRASGDVMVFNCAVRVDNLAPGALENDLGPRLAQMVRSIESALDQE